MLEPELMTNLFDRARVKRRRGAIRRNPQSDGGCPALAEDKHFFQHKGFDPVGIVRAAYVE